MKKIVVLLFAVLVALSCKEVKEGEFSINGKVDNYFNGKYVSILAKNIETGETILNDSVLVKNGTFILEGTQKEPVFAYVFLKDSKGKFDQLCGPTQIIIEPGTIKLTSEKTEKLFKVKATGTATNNDMNLFVESIKAKSTALNKLYENVKSEEDYKKVKSQVERIDNELKAAADNYIKNNPTKSWSLLMIAGKFDYQDPIEELKALFASLDNELQKSTVGQQVGNVISKRMKLAIGQKVTDFKSKSDKGTDFNLLSSLGSKVTILDFWASWCGPCRMENPNLVRIYNKYKKSGLEIISYSIDDNEKAWKLAIEKDRMTWIHASNLKGQEDNVAELFQIQAVPTVFILDNQGIIVAKNIRGDELEAKIVEILKRH